VSFDLAAYLETARRQVERTLSSVLPPEHSQPASVHAAMRHSVFAGGKRLRPILALTAARAGDAGLEELLRPAAALELIHTYSLIHDDLPAMDDAPLRRGKPSCHAAFGEAIAILAGDALLTLAFEELAGEPSGAAWAERRLAALASVARAAGSLGMVGGQAADLEAERLAPEEADEKRLESIHTRKTGALIVASLELGGILSGLDPAALSRLRRYGRAIGLAFQIADDLLDVEGDAAALGKQAGEDARAGKLTYPALLGVEASRRRARELVDEAVDAVQPLDGASAPLTVLAGWIIERPS